MKITVLGTWNVYTIIEIEDEYGWIYECRNANNLNAICNTFDNEPSAIEWCLEN